MNIKCNHCGSVSNAKQWNEATVSYYGVGSLSIEQGIYNNNLAYRCPKCDRECFKDDRREIEDGKS